MALVIQGRASEGRQLKRMMWDSYVSASKGAVPVTNLQRLSVAEDHPSTAWPGTDAVNDSNALATTEPVWPSRDLNDSLTTNHSAADLAQFLDANRNGRRSAISATREEFWSLLSQTVTGEVTDILKGRPPSTIDPPSLDGAIAMDGQSGRHFRRVTSIKDSEEAILASVQASRKLLVPDKDKSLWDSIAIPVETLGDFTSPDDSRDCAGVNIPTLGLQCASQQFSQTLRETEEAFEQCFERERQTLQISADARAHPEAGPEAREPSLVTHATI